MEIVTPDIPPYLPSTAWCRKMKKPDTARFGRTITRTLVTSNAPGGQVLTVPIVGGSAAVKRDDPHSFRISSHGDWTRIHLGAMEAAYGKEPYFQHFFPEIAGIIGVFPPELETLNRRLLEAMLRQTGYADEIDGIRRMRMRTPKRFASIERRLIAGIDMEHSMIEPLFRYGKDTLFMLTEMDDKWI